MPAQSAFSEETIAARLRSAYGIETLAIAPLAGGADLANTVFRVTATNGAWFAKLRAAPPNGAALALARHLSTSGIEGVVAPIPTTDGRLADEAGAQQLIVFPWVEGLPATTAPMSESQWLDFGQSVRHVHETVLTDALAASLRHEEFSPRWRDTVRDILASPPDAGSDAEAALHTLLRTNRNSIGRLLDVATYFAGLLRGRTHALVPCHGDLHAANVIVHGARARIVDWDDPLMAPRERDLMFIGAGICGVWKGDAETAAFHRGYGPADADPSLLAYYRCERILEDIGVTCGEIRTMAGTPDARSRLLRQLADQFEPGAVVEIALQSARDATTA